jgi:DNA-binding CsgD family transcriptional regulator
MIALTPRHARMVALVAEGKANKEIAFLLGLAESSVKEYLYRIFRKVGVSNRTELAIWAVRRETDDMPCHDDRDDERERRAYAELRIVNRVACDLARVLRNGGTFEDTAVETKAWVQAHDEYDASVEAQRLNAVARERLRVAAMAKLTPEERRILGC